MYFALSFPAFLPWPEPLIIPLCGMIHLLCVLRLCRFQARTMLNVKAQFPCIPNTAIIQGTDNSAKVICVIKNYAVIKNITIKEQKNGYVWISDGIEKNEIIVNNPSPFIREGQLVEIIK